MSRPEPKYKIGQVLKNTANYAEGYPNRPVLNVEWDGIWNCYTYLFERSLIRIPEDQLEPVTEGSAE